MRPPIQLRKRTVPNGAKWCQMVPNGATLVLLPPVTTGSEEDPGAQPDDWTQGLRLSLEGIRGGLNDRMCW